jgi:phospholipid/cholesterol/gamma-HCH transport system permease protein
MAVTTGSDRDFSRPMNDRLDEFGDLAEYSVSTLRQLPGSFRYTAEILRQLAILVRGSTVIIAVMVLFVGFSATNYGYYFLKSAGAADYVGLVPGVVGARLVAALLFGYAFAAKVGCGLVAEIGSMRINEELDALESEGIPTQRYVVGTRVIAALLFTPIITPIALAAATVGAWIDAVVVVHAVPSATFFQFDWSNQSFGDQIFAFVLIIIIATTIVLVSCFYGMRTKGGPAGVGTAVARSLVINLVMIHVIIGLGDALIYGGGNLGLPIGG